MSEADDWYQGTVERGRTLTDVRRYEYDHVDGGTLVYVVLTEHREHLDREVRIGRRLHGFANVTDWDAVRSELARRGHDVGAIHHLPVMEGGL